MYEWNGRTLARPGIVRENHAAVRALHDGNHAVLRIVIRRLYEKHGPPERALIYLLDLRTPRYGGGPGTSSRSTLRWRSGTSSRPRLVWHGGFIMDGHCFESLVNAHT